MMRNGNLAGLIAIGLRLGSIMGLAGLAVTALPQQVLALENWQFDAGKEQLVISLPKGVTPRYYLMAEPARIILDLPNTEIATATEQSYGGAVRQIRVAQFQPGLARIVLELSPEAVLAPGQVELQQIQGSDDAAIQRWTLRPLLAGTTSSASSATTSRAPVPSNSSITPAAQPAPVSTAAAPIAPSSTATTPTATTPTATSALPPLEPGAIEIPVELPAQPAAQSNPGDRTSRVAVTPTQPSPTPTANLSPPIQVDFSTPLPATSAELASTNGSATALSLPSGREVASPQSTGAPSKPPVPMAPSGAGSFPIPTADGISVPSLNTIASGAPAATSTPGTTGNVADDRAAKPATHHPARTMATTHPAPVNPAPANPAPASRPTTSPVQTAVGPTLPRTIQVIPFGQPLPQ